MLGKKCSLAPLKEELRIQGVRFCHYHPSVSFFETGYAIIAKDGLELIKCPRLASNLSSFFPGLLSIGSTGGGHHSWLLRVCYFFFPLDLFYFILFID
jgi:hypothetical protein